MQQNCRWAAYTRSYEKTLYGGHLMNTEGYDNDNIDVLKYWGIPVSGAHQKMPFSYGEQKKMKSVRVFSVLTGWNEVCEQGWAQSSICVGVYKCGKCHAIWYLSPNSLLLQDPPPPSLGWKCHKDTTNNVLKRSLSKITCWAVHWHLCIRALIQHSW